MYKRILVAIDNSSRSDRVLETVESLARLTGGAVDVLHAEESHVVYDTVVKVEEHDDAQAVVGRAVTRLTEAGVQAKGEVVEALSGQVPDVILNRAREAGSDLVVLGPRHHSRIGALLGGSVSGEVALHTPISVLLVV
ncbi:universal stress protein [Planotetraspora sp. GP83]|uniref:universal stress protein n=1 Tax=Planotetraspora sp. GP83 TaxID=3156264 RepID=UPI003511C40A